MNLVHVIYVKFVRFHEGKVIPCPYQNEHRNFQKKVTSSEHQDTWGDGEIDQDSSKRSITNIYVKYRNNTETSRVLHKDSVESGGYARLRLEAYYLKICANSLSSPMISKSYASAYSVTNTRIYKYRLTRGGL